MNADEEAALKALNRHLDAVGPFQEIAISALYEFEHLSDYLWKIPTFLNDQRKIEGQKLRTYFPASEDPESIERATRLRRLRFLLEAPKLFDSFPRFMSASGFLIAFGVFEEFAIQTCDELERSARVLPPKKWNGISTAYDQWRLAGVDPASLPDWRIVDHAAAFRNCLIHANGFYEKTRGAKKIATTISDLSYLPTMNGEPTSEFLVVSKDTPRGPQLSMGSLYVHRMASILSRYLVEACVALSR